MLQIKDLTGISPVDQKLVKTDPIKNKSIPIDVRDVRMPIHKISLNKGDLIHLKESQNVRAKTNHKPKKKPESKVEQPVKKGPHMTFKAFVKISGKPTIPNYEDFLFQPNRQRSVSSYAPNVHWKLQRYRHTDIISFPDPMVLQKFYRNSLPELKQGMSRIGIMFGRYVEDVNPLVKQNVTDDLKRQKKWDFDANGVRGDVYAIYEPPQEAQKNGARFLTDPRQEVVQILAEEMGLEAIGLAICKVKAKEDPKGFQTFLTGAELLQLARLQSVFRDQDGFSRFGCVLIEQAELIEPRAFAASDICVALEGSNLLDTVEGHPFKLRCKIPEGVRASDMPQFYIPKDNDMSGGTHQAKEKIKTGDPFPIDFLTVKIIVGQGRGLHGLMKHIEFPLNGTLKDLKGYMERHSGETFHQKFSDFNLILNLPDFFEDEKDKECAVEIAACIGKRLEFPPELCEKLDIWFVKKSLF
uniref:Nuclear pore localisation protein NPL4 C-terminal domain-containing protein n=1 Tax=Amorphochlora amoebiformis TaxID=1561963 RepID=A0A7S0D2P7_9EUKA